MHLPQTRTTNSSSAFNKIKLCNEPTAGLKCLENDCSNCNNCRCTGPIGTSAPVCSRQPNTDSCHN